MKMVIDTSVFVNPSVRKQFGRTVDSAVRNFVKYARKSDYDFYMPPSVFREMEHFTSEIRVLETVVNRKSPDLYSLTVPAKILYDLVDDVRRRIDKGLKIAEKFSKEESSPEAIRKLREQFRYAVRHGIVDSKEDVDVVLLSMELGAIVVSADEGILKLAESLGCSWIMAENLKRIIE